MEKIRLYFSLAGADVRSQMQHKSSFIMGAIGDLSAPFADFVALVTMFATFGALPGWELAEVCILFGMMNLSLSLATCIGRGIDSFTWWIRYGDFDRYLLRPHGTLFQLLSSMFGLTRLGRVTQGAVALALGLLMLDKPFGGAQVALLIWCILGGVLLYFGILIVQAAVCFWTVESVDAFNILTFGGTTMAAYPLDIYKKWLRDFFLYVVPLGLVNYLPCAVLFGKELPYPAFTAYLAPAAGLAFLLSGIALWQLGVRRYRSVGA